jgi:hypothetical protein
MFTDSKFIFSRYDDTGQIDSFPGQVLLNLKTGESGKMKVHNGAVRLALSQRVQELAPGAESLNLITEGSKQTTQGLADRRFVVHQTDSQASSRHLA